LKTNGDLCGKEKGRKRNYKEPTDDSLTDKEKGSRTLWEFVARKKSGYGKETRILPVEAAGGRRAKRKYWDPFEAMMTVKAIESLLQWECKVSKREGGCRAEAGPKR